MTKTITIGHFLILRLKEIGIDTIFGVPGDYTLKLLDLIEDDPEMTWGNNVNELNSAYAADGYARIRGAGAVFTVMGVGELSAINGLAGSFAEMVPVIHIVGYASTIAQQEKRKVHHTLGNGDYDIFYNMASPMCAASTKLTLSNATVEIDRVIKTVYEKKLPGYIGIPMDLILSPVDFSDIASSLSIYSPKVINTALQNDALTHILQRIQKASHPILLVDLCVSRFQMKKVVEELIRKTGFPVFCTPMGRGAVHQHLPNYCGIYNGEFTLELAHEEYKKADLVIELGSTRTDFNTGIFSANYNQSNTITLNAESISIGYTEYPHIGIQEIVPLLTEAIIPEKREMTEIDLPYTMVDSHTTTVALSDSKHDEINTNELLSQSFFWDTLPELMNKDSILVTDHGSVVWGSLAMKPPTGHTTFVNQGHWASIGYAVPATLGACMADRHRTVYLVVGDGSYQVSAQEIAVFIRQGITPVILLINNDGYLIEKLIHAPHRSYHNFQMWNYSQSLDFFGGHMEINAIGRDKHPSVIGVQTKIKTCQGFINIMKRIKQEPNKIHFVELILPPLDSNQGLSMLCNNK